MLKIKLEEFRCWENITIEIPIGEITLIKGSSGAGKTTLLQGIIWCLYGNVRSITPHHKNTAKTSVTIEIPIKEKDEIMKINRRKNPNRLIFNKNGEIYEDKVAQSLIEEIFGKYEIWLASCYIGQGYRNSFLTSPNDGKMELLNIIAFHEEDPNIYIEKIDKILIETNNEYNIKLSLFQNKLNHFENVMSKIDMTKALNEEETMIIKNKIQTLTKELEYNKEKKNKRDINIGLLENLEKKLEYAKLTIIDFPSEPSELKFFNDKYEMRKYDTQENVDHNMKIATNIIYVLQRRDDLKAEAKKLEVMLSEYDKTILDKNISYTIEDYQNTLLLESKYFSNKDLSNKLGVLYNENDIQENIKNYRKILDSQERIKIELECQFLQKEINKLKSEINNDQIIIPTLIPKNIIQPDYTKYSITSLSNKLNELSMKQGNIQSNIHHLEINHQIVKCPKCDEELRYNDGKLLLINNDPINQYSLEQLKLELNNNNKEISILNQEIKLLISEEKTARYEYEKLINDETKRINIVNEQIKQAQFNEQKRILINKSKEEEIIKLTSKHINLFKLLETLPTISPDTKILSSKDVTNYHSIIANLSSISVIDPPPVSSKYIYSCLTYQDLSNKYRSSIISLDNHVQTISTVFKNESIVSVQHYINLLQTYWSNFIQCTHKLSDLTKLKQLLSDQINHIKQDITDDPSSIISSLILHLSDLQTSLDLSIKANESLVYHSQLTSDREHILKINNYLSNLNILRQYSVETECQLLTHVVDSINSSIFDVCSTLFDRDINIKLNMFKTLKKTNNIKPKVNFTISYQGGSFDNINDMSGGEGDRASIALTLALNRLSSCPILLLDESLASLDLNMKESTINTIREHTNNTIIVIMHDGIEGIFDNVLDIDSFVNSRYVL